MADRPTETIGWAINQVDEVVNIGGSGVLVTNKVEPTTELKNSGVKAREKWARPYLNWLFNFLMRWIDNLQSRESFVGVIKMSNDTAGRTVTDYQNEFGGTWADRGTEVLAGQTIRIFERVL